MDRIRMLIFALLLVAFISFPLAAQDTAPGIKLIPGSVVKVSGEIEGLGVVVEYSAGEFLSLTSLDGFETFSYRLTNVRYRIDLLADSVESYKKLAAEGKLPDQNAQRVAESAPGAAAPAQLGAPAAASAGPASNPYKRPVVEFRLSGGLGYNLLGGDVDRYLNDWNDSLGYADSSSGEYKTLKWVKSGEAGLYLNNIFGGTFFQVDLFVAAGIRDLSADSDVSYEVEGFDFGDKLKNRLTAVPLKFGLRLPFFVPIPGPSGGRTAMAALTLGGIYSSARYAWDESFENPLGYGDISFESTTHSLGYFMSLDFDMSLSRNIGLTFGGGLEYVSFTDFQGDYVETGRLLGFDYEIRDRSWLWYYEDGGSPWIAFSPTAPSGYDVDSGSVRKAKISIFNMNFMLGLRFSL